jgi:hypothetical protein
VGLAAAAVLRGPRRLPRPRRAVDHRPVSRRPRKPRLRCDQICSGQILMDGQTAVGLPRPCAAVESAVVESMEPAERPSRFTYPPTNTDTTPPMMHHSNREREGGGGGWGSPGVSRPIFRWFAAFYFTTDLPLMKTRSRPYFRRSRPTPTPDAQEPLARSGSSLSRPWAGGWSG